MPVPRMNNGAKLISQVCNKKALLSTMTKLIDGTKGGVAQFKVRPIGDTLEVTLAVTGKGANRQVMDSLISHASGLGKVLSKAMGSVGDLVKLFL